MDAFASFSQTLEDPAVLAGLTGFVACLLASFAARWSLTRSAKRTVPVAAQNLSPSARHHVCGRSLGRQSLAAALNKMAEKQYLSIEQDGEGVRLRKADGNPAALPTAEKALGNALLRLRSSLSLDEKSEPVLGEAQQAFVQGVLRECDETLDRPVRRALLPAAVIAVLTALAVTLLSEAWGQAAFLTFGGGIATAAAVIMIYDLPRIWAARLSGNRGARTTVFIVAAGLALLAVALWSILGRTEAEVPSQAVGFSVLAFMVTAWSYEAVRTQRRTLARAHLADTENTESRQDLSTGEGVYPLHRDLSERLRASADAGRSLEQA